MRSNKGKVHGSTVGITIGAIALLGILSLVVWAAFFRAPVQNTALPVSSAQPAASAPGAIPPVSGTAQCQVAQAYGYTAVDALQSGVAVPGTTYIKSGSLAPVTSLAAPNPGQLLSFWMSNATTLCPVVDVNSQPIGSNAAGTLVLAPTAGATCGTANLQSRCYNNGSVTLSVYTSPANTALTNGGGANNATSAVGQSNYNVYFAGTSKKSELPFGGCVAIEYPNNVTSMSFGGNGITGASCPYVWTAYTTHSTTNNVQEFAVPAGFDINQASIANLPMLLSLTSATNAPKGTVYVDFQAANYYVGNDGNYHFGIQKDANADTALTNGNTVLFSFVTS